MRMPNLATSTVVLLVLAACSNAPVPQPAPNAAPAPAPVAQGPSAQRSSTEPAPVDSAQPGRLAHLDPSGLLLRERSVYFDYDTADIPRRYMAILERHGQYLKDHQSVKVIIEGNADERGGSEYNLALGQRRSDSVRSALRLLGVREAQIDAISFGEEKPLAAGHDELSWQKNRRADIVYVK